MTFVQRYGDALNVNVHFHCLVIDGVYAAGEHGRPEFYRLPAPEDADVLRLTMLVSEKIQFLLRRRGFGTEVDPQQADPLSRDDPGMSAMLANSVRRRIAVGSHTGRGFVRRGDRIDGDSLDAFDSPRCAMVSGFSVHANVSIEARDRMRLERLIRYAARPAVATERLTALPDGRLLYRLKRPWRDGTSAVIFERQDFIAKLAVLVPAPRTHLTRYHGVLAPAALWRRSIIPTANDHHSDSLLNAQPSPQRSTALAVAREPVPRTLPSAHPRNYIWAELMKRVFEIDVLQCERCGGPMKIVAAIHPPETTAKILECLGLPSRAPRLSPAVSDPDCDMDSF